MQVARGASILFLASLSSVAWADEDTKYNAFDLALKRIPLAKLQPGESFTSGSVTVGQAPGTCVVKETAPKQIGVYPDDDDPKKATCPIFSAREPDKVVVERKIHSGATTVTTITKSEFDKGVSPTGGVWFDGPQVTLERQPGGPAPNETVCVAYYQVSKSAWAKEQVTVAAHATGSILLKLSVEPVGGVYLRAGACPSGDAAMASGSITRLAPNLAMRDLSTPMDCANEKQFSDVYLPKNGKNHIDYSVCIDQANALGHARLVANREHYTTQFTWGRLRVRHWRNVVPVLLINGAAVSIAPPAFISGTTPTSSTTPPNAATTSAGGYVLPSFLDGQGAATTITGDVAYSDIYIPPHAPGALHLDLRLVDPVNAQPKTATSIDMVVDQGYSGAIRVGVAQLFGVHDFTYEKIQRAGTNAKEIAERTAVPKEVVLGYAVFFGGPAGRTYGLTSAWASRHLGLFLGFGAVSYTPEQLDFLKSIHAGLDIEIGRHFSLALTLITRRTKGIDSKFAAVGGPAPEGDIPTTTRYDTGVGFVLTFSPEFLRFVQSARTAGGEK